MSKFQVEVPLMLSYQFLKDLSAVYDVLHILAIIFHGSFLYDPDGNLTFSSKLYR